MKPTGTGATPDRTASRSIPDRRARACDAKAYLRAFSKCGKKGRTVRLVISSYDAATDAVTLLIRGRVKPGPKFQGTIFGSGPDELIAASGMPLDGNQDGQPGSNASFLVKSPRPSKRK